MKKLLYVLFVLYSLMYNKELLSCDLSSFSLVSISGTGPFTIATRLCIGGGITGVVKGADNDTKTIMFGFYSSNPAFAVSSFSPSDITGSFTGCTMSGSNIGSLGTPFNTNVNIMYADPGYYGYEPCASTPFQCINSTALCGDRTTQCITFIFTTNILPDTIQAFGVEGAGNALAGCYSYPDMMIDFNNLLPIFWGSISAKYTNENTVSLDWTTLSEVNNHFFTIEKSKTLNTNTNSLEWQFVKNINGTNKNTPTNYQYIDENPFPNKTYYRIKQTDFDGRYTYSKILFATYKNKASEIKIYPNPISDRLNIEAKEAKRISIINSLGMEVFEDSNLTDELNTIDVSKISDGLYLLKIEHEDGTVETSKIIKSE